MMHRFDPTTRRTINETPNSRLPVKPVTIVLDESSLYEAMYVSGQLVRQDSNIYAADIAVELGGCLAALTTHSVDMGLALDWPERLSEIKESDID